jgi:tripartite-type tricarboxylate transporter receptor subunit TctC
MKAFCRVALAALCLSLLDRLPAAAQAQYPDRPIRIVVGFTPGGGNDIIARIFGQKLSESLGQPVRHREQARRRARSSPPNTSRDRRPMATRCWSAPAAPMVINPAVYEKLKYDTMRDFKPVSELGSFPLILIVNAKSPFKSLAELVAYAKANPDKANYSSSSAAFQLATELFKQKTGVPMQMIPYKGRQ